MSIDLRAAVVGDKFDSANERYELLIKTDKDYVVKGNGGRIYVVNSRGGSYEADAVKLISKYEPRHWLKDLPDADLFVGGWLAENNGSGWFCHENEPNRDDGNGGVSLYADSGRSVSCLCLKMPTLTGDEWRDSKVSIDDLRTWQKENKARGE